MEAILQSVIMASRRRSERRPLWRLAIIPAAIPFTLWNLPDAAAASGKLNCQKPGDTEYLESRFQAVPADPLNGSTITEQDEVFSCGEGLIEARIKKFSGKSKPKPKDVKELVYFAAKTIPYDNTEYGMDFAYEIGSKFFKRNPTAVSGALKLLQDSNVLTPTEIRGFRAGVLGKSE